MAVLNITLKPGVLGIGRKTGQIRVTNPQGTIRFNKTAMRPDMTFTHPIEGTWDFPAGLVREMRLVAHTDKDYDWTENNPIRVEGEPQGDFVRTAYIWHANTETSARFDLLLDNNQRIISDYYTIQMQIVGGQVAATPETFPVVGSTGEFTARISKITRGSHPSGDIPVMVYYDIGSVPIGTSGLSLAFVTNQEWPQGRDVWEGPKDYGFTGHIWSGHSGILGKSAGKGVSITTILRAESEAGLVLGETRGRFTLDQVKD